MEFDNQQQPMIELDRHFDDVRTTLSHAKELLQSAIASLLDDALAIRTALAQQKATLNNNDPNRQETLLALGKQMEDGTNNLIMHLQFQDMVNQLLDHVEGGLTALEADSARGGQQTQSGNPAPNSVDQPAKGKPVTSCDMQAGDVELF